jgi:EmrB/QacA subfamily drug resistance transporter
MHKQDHYPWMLFISTSLGIILVMLNAGSLNVVLPAITTRFHAGPVHTSWVLLSYMLFYTIFIFIFGKVADIYGRRKLYLLGLSGFTGVSFLCGLATNIWLLIMLRILQGIAGALIMTNTTTLLVENFPEDKLGTALGLNVAVVSTAQLLGPVVGGLLVYLFDWRWTFWFNVPIGIIGIFWAAKVLRRGGQTAAQEKVDFGGNMAIFLALGGLILALSEGGVIGWRSMPVIAGIVLFFIALVCFVAIERKTDYPMLDFSLFRNRAYTMANVAVILVALARSSIVLVISLYFQVVHQVNPFAAGLQVLPLTAGLIIASLMTGILSRRFATRSLSTAGMLVCALGIATLLLNIGPDASLFSLSAGQFLAGIGCGIFQTPNTHSIMMSVPANRRGIANGLRSMLNNMGIVISTAYSLMIISSVLPPNLKNALYLGAGTVLSAQEVAQITHGYRLLFLSLFFVTLCATAASFLRSSTQIKSTE